MEEKRCVGDDAAGWTADEVGRKAVLKVDFFLEALDDCQRELTTMH